VVFSTSSRSKVRTGGIGLARGPPRVRRLRQRRHDAEVILCAFDLIEFDGEDLRSRPIEERKRSLARRLRQALRSLVLDQFHDAPCNGHRRGDVDLQAGRPGRGARKVWRGRMRRQPGPG
jgi:hypothetical protein